MIFFVGDVWEPVVTATIEKTSTVTAVALTGTLTDPNEGTSAVSFEAEGESKVAKIELTLPGQYHLAVVASGEHKGANRETITVQPL